MNERPNPSIPEPPHKTEPHHESDQSNEIFLMTDTMHRHPWAVTLLRDFGQAIPSDLESSWRAAQITASVMLTMRQQDDNSVFHKPAVVDTMILGAALQDIGRGTPEDLEMREEVYTRGERWRDDPDAWQWEVVKHHPRKSHDLILAATGNPDKGVAYDAAQIVLLHHTRKRRDPYPDVEEGVFELLDPIVRQGIEIVAAVDVAEAISRNFRGKGRPYLEDEEFADQSLSEAVQSEIIVDDRIADLVAHHTLRYKAGYSY